MKDMSLRKRLILITYTAALLFLILEFDIIYGIFKNVTRVLTPFIMGIALAFILNKPMVFFINLYSRFIKKKGVSKALAILSAYLLFFAIIAAILLIIVPQLLNNIKNFMGSLSVYIRQIEKLSIEITEKYDLQSIDLSTIFDEIKDVIKNLSSWILTYIANLLPQLVTVTSNIVSVLFNLIVTIVVSINILSGKERLLRQGKEICYVYLPLKWAKRSEKVVRLSNNIFGKFIVGQLTEACILGGLCFLGMKIFKFDYAILISTLICVTALIPVVGAWIGGGIAFLLLALVSPIKAILFIIYLSILQQLENNLIYPRVVGSSIGLPGLWVMFAVTVGGGLFGLSGMILSVPIMSIVYALIKEDVSNKSKV